MTSTAYPHYELDWTPASQASGTMNSHNLVLISPHRLELRHSGGIVIIALILLTFGVLVPGILGIIFAIKGLWAGTIIGGMAALSSLTMGILLLGQAGKVAVIDKAQGWYWPPGTEPRSKQQLERLAQQAGAIRLDDIALVQVLKKRVKNEMSRGSRLPNSGVSKPFVSTEINLVTHQGKRINLIDHGNPIAITGQIETIANFLELPVEENTLATA